MTSRGAPLYRGVRLDARRMTPHDGELVKRFVKRTTTHPPAEPDELVVEV